MCQHVLAQLVCLGNHTVTGLLAACGQQFQDWSAGYRLYANDRINPEQLFEPVRQWVCDHQAGPVVIALDDTRLRKTGTKIHGVKYTRDPLSPPFHTNFIRAQRFVQTSMAWAGSDGQARMIPVDWTHAPTPAKLRPNADEQQRADHRALSQQTRLSLVGLQRIEHLRQWLDAHGAKQRMLWAVVDGSYTNETVLKHLPERTTLVGRIRGDAKLYYLPQCQPQKGRRRSYGQPAPTPEQVRVDETIPWRQVSVFYGGEVRLLRVKQIKPLRWRTAGQTKNLQLLVIAPTPYRLNKKSKLLYRQPAYLICTDPDASLQQIVQHYLWRWDIEVNFRDQKTLLGLGDAQVRTPHAVQNFTGTAVAAYAMLITAAAKCKKHNLNCQHLPAPKWQPKRSHRPTTMRLIQNLRHELWAQSIHFYALAIRHQLNTKPEKTRPCLQSTLFYATRYS
jgi:hypothetical protein